MLRKAEMRQSLTPKEDPLDDKDWSTRYPYLYCMLAQVVWDDQTPRLPATLLIFVEPTGVLKLCLNDREMNRSVFVTATTFAGALQTLEDGLQSQRLDWRTRRNSGYGQSQVPF